MISFFFFIVPLATQSLLNIPVQHMGRIIGCQHPVNYTSSRYHIAKDINGKKLLVTLHSLNKMTKKFYLLFSNTMRI